MCCFDLYYFGIIEYVILFVGEVWVGFVDDFVVFFFGDYLIYFGDVLYIFEVMVVGMSVVFIFELC